MVAVVHSSLIFGSCCLLPILLNIVSSSTLLDEITTSSSVSSSGKGTPGNITEADILTSEMNNFTAIRDEIRQNGGSKEACSTHASTLKFLCLYAVASDQEMHDEPGKRLSRREGAPAPQIQDVRTPAPSLDPSAVDVMCMKRKVDPNDGEVHLPFRTISCCETTGQKCTYHEDVRSKYIVRCHSTSKEKTAYLVECCGRTGRAFMNKTDNQQTETDYKCY